MFSDCLPLIGHLLDLGANVHHRDTEGSTVLFNACIKGTRELLKVLIGAGCHIQQVILIYLFFFQQFNFSRSSCSGYRQLTTMFLSS